MLNNFSLKHRAFLFGGLLLLDQASKLLFFNYLKIATLNRDLAFSVKFLNPLALNILTLAIFSLLIYFYNKNYLTKINVLLIYAGAVSNIIDRVIRGGVVDFIDFKIWPSFNLADSLIFIGSLWLIIDLIKKR